MNKNVEGYEMMDILKTHFLPSSCLRLPRLLFLYASAIRLQRRDDVALPPQRCRVLRTPPSPVQHVATTVRRRLSCI